MKACYCPQEQPNKQGIPYQNTESTQKTFVINKNIALINDTIDTYLISSINTYSFAILLMSIIIRRIDSLTDENDRDLTTRENASTRNTLPPNGSQRLTERLQLLACGAPSGALGNLLDGEGKHLHGDEKRRDEMNILQIMRPLISND